MKELAPYGQYLKEENLKDKFDIALICIGEKAQLLAQNLQSHLPFTLYLPYPSSPFKYMWPLNKCEVHLIDTGKSSFSFIKHCSLCFFSFGALEVKYISQYRSFTIEKDI